MKIFRSICLRNAYLLSALRYRLRSCWLLSMEAMGKKPRRFAVGVLAVTIGIGLASCGSSQSIRVLTISPSDGTVFVGAATTQAAAIRNVRGKRSAASINAQPQDFSTATCGNLQYSATALYADGTMKDISNLVSWTSSNTSAATITGNGNATGVALGITYVEAKSKNLNSGSVPLYVDALNSMQVSPVNPTLPMGSQTVPSTVQFSAVGAFTQANGTPNSRDVSSLVTWSSTNPGVATISPSGLASSVAQGTTTIVGTVCGISNTSTLTVGPPGPISLQITPATPTIAVGTSVPFVAVELWSDGTTHGLTAPVAWSSSGKSMVISNLTGAAFGASAGTATITALETTGSALTGTATVTVQAAQAQFAYLANLQGNGTGSISSFTVSAATGTLTSLASTGAAAPQQVLLEPSGNFLYSIDSTSSVHVYQITTPSAATPTIPAGTLTLLDSTIPPVLAGGGHKNIGVIDPTGQFFYVIDYSANTLYGFQIQQSQTGQTPFGSLQAISGSPFSGLGFTLDSPTWVMTDRTGQFLYVVNAGNNTISGFLIDFNGTLTPIVSSAPFPQTGNAPRYGAMDNQSHMYVANSADNSVSAYLLNADGTWASIGTLSVAGATSVVNVLTDPKSKYVYVLDQGGPSGGQVYGYNLIPPALGTIFGDQISPPQPVGSIPNGMAVDPSGVLLAVDNSGSSNISLFQIAKGSTSVAPGSLTPAVPNVVATDQSPQFVVFYNALPVHP